MKYLNLGCGYNYSTEREWTNVDFISTGAGVLAHNLLTGIPFKNNSFDLVYHSHVLEHFKKEDAEIFIQDCLRVLKPGGIIRIAIPDLETIATNYLNLLKQGIEYPNDELIELNYTWTMLELYDQTVRTKSGGNMANFIFNDTIKNEQFITERLGQEVIDLRASYLERKNQFVNKYGEISQKDKWFKNISSIKKALKNYLLEKLHVDQNNLAIGNFRQGGEIHQWMYDRYSLSKLLYAKGASQIEKRDPFTSYISNWEQFGLDGNRPVVRKPDSLFMEAIK